MTLQKKCNVGKCTLLQCYNLIFKTHKVAVERHCPVKYGSNIQNLIYLTRALEFCSNITHYFDAIYWYMYHII